MTEAHPQAQSIAMHYKTRPQGFTLAELLIALSILGVIATYTIPKVIVVQQNGQYNAAAKEVAAMISGAYQLALEEGLIHSATTAGALTPYMNYLGVDTSTPIDGMYGNTTNTCSGSTKCLTLHNGGKLLVFNVNFAGNSTTNAVMYQFDPDGRVTDGTTNSPGKSLKFVLYYNGRITTRGTVAPGTKDSVGTYSPTATVDPPWFHW